MNVREPLPTAESQLPISDARPPSRRWYLIVAMVALLALAWGAYGRWQRDVAAIETQEQILNFVPEVRVAIVKRQDGPVALTLPGSVLPFDQARIYARATGYIAERRVDIGSRVHTGDLLVRIAAPDLDHQLSEAQARLGQIQAAMEQARAATEQARSDAALADVTNSRTLRLATQGWESKQNADNTRLGLASKLAAVANAEAGVRVAEANVRAQEATVRRLLQLTQYEKVEAPFNGVITARNVDNGDLVKADDNSGGTALFTVQRDDVVRVQVNVPQSGAVGLQDGLPAKVHVPELPGRTFEGKVARNSVALDAASRTMVAEVDVPNPDGALRAGLYVNVDFSIPRQAPTVLVPAEALLFNGDGLRVATVDDAGRVHMRNVSVYRDYGATLELREGLQGGERVALTLPADVTEGQQVKALTRPEDDKTTAK
ncbi:MAG TPA: efflux RND transporter periplasmic adaptor subunit [Xanthobacteraceae bacterium]|nr:efflux RND transporter periplasmic adaptor subunit [Xanthobacteraceae bacterium]